MLSVGAGEPALFASDMHLDAASPGTVDTFLAGLDAHAPGAAHLFLLGDLFELWVGDDGADAVADRLAGRLAALSARGTRVWLMRGNRDFLLDAPLPGREAPPFSARCGATMLDDPCPVLLHGTPALVSHGDALCTDDEVYQAWRATCRDAGWQRAFLSRPLEERFAVGRSVRETSEAGKREKPGFLMDVNPGAVDAAMDAAGAALLIHGHTHRPAVHRWRHAGGERTRVVLPDWDVAQRRGGFVRWRDGRAETLPAPGAR